ncbi:hypothetical protein HmCmsJML268_01364 [Escherichia coli]|nr:hypothetical protein HmCmsJML268_01364 [Escherichia coli]
MLVGKRRALAETRHIGTQVIHPHIIGTVLILIRVRHRPFGKEQHVGLHALSVKNTGRQTQNGVQMTLIHQVTTNVGAFAAFKQHVIRHHRRRTTAGVQRFDNMLHKAQLFVAGRVNKGAGNVGACGAAKRRVSGDNMRLRQVFAVAAQGVAQTDCAAVVEVAFNIVQQAVHQRQTTGAGHQFEADKRAVDLEILRVAIKVVQIVSLRLNVAVGFNQKARRTGCRILYHFTWLRFQQMNNGFNQRTRGEVLARARLGFIGVLLQQPFVHIAEVIARLTVRTVVPVQ